MSKFIKYLKSSSWWLIILFIILLSLFLIFYFLAKNNNNYNDARTAFLVLLIIFSIFYVIISYTNGFLIFLYDWKHKQINSGKFKIPILIFAFIFMSFSNLIAIYYIDNRLVNIKKEDETEYIKPYPF